MLDFYTDLNNARKEKDDKYIEQQYIGEEVVEPDEKPIQITTNLHDYLERDEDKPVISQTNNLSKV